VAARAILSYIALHAKLTVIQSSPPDSAIYNRGAPGAVIIVAPADSSGRSKRAQRNKDRW